VGRCASRFCRALPVRHGRVLSMHVLHCPADFREDLDQGRRKSMGGMRLKGLERRRPAHRVLRRRGPARAWGGKGKGGAGFHPR
jgi:hypothetical protein